MSKELIKKIDSSSMKVKRVKHSVKTFLPQGAKSSSVKKFNNGGSYLHVSVPATITSMTTFACMQISLLERNGFNSNIGVDGAFWIGSLIASVIGTIVSFTVGLEDYSDWQSDYEHEEYGHRVSKKAGTITFFKNNNRSYRAYDDSYANVLTVKSPSKLSIFDPTALFRRKKISHYVSYESDTRVYKEEINYVHGIRTKTIVKTYDSEMSLFDSALDKMRFIHSEKS